MDASGQIRHDHAGGQFRLAWPAGRRGGRGRRPPQEESAGLADDVQFGKKAVADLSGRRGMVRVWTSGVSGGDFRAHRAWRKALGDLISRSKHSSFVEGRLPATSYLALGLERFPPDVNHFVPNGIPYLQQIRF